LATSAPKGPTGAGMFGTQGPSGIIQGVMGPTGPAGGFLNMPSTQIVINDEMSTTRQLFSKNIPQPMYITDAPNSILAVTSGYTTNDLVYTFGKSRNIVYSAIGGVGSGIGPMISRDMKNWSTPISQSSNTPCRIVWDGVKWIMTQNTNTTLVSYNDNLFSSIPTSAGVILSSIAKNTFMYVGIGKGGIFYSYDGLNWYNSSSGTALINNSTATQVGKVVWNGSIWVAVGSGTSYTISYSYDGINWTGVSNSLALFGSTGGATDVVWNGTTFIAGGIGSNVLATSSDGISWTLGNVLIPPAPTIGTITSTTTSVTIPLTFGQTPYYVSSYNYNVYNDNTFVVSGTTNTTPLTISGLTAGIIYTINLSAVNVYGSSPYTSFVKNLAYYSTITYGNTYFGNFTPTSQNTTFPFVVTTNGGGSKFTSGSNTGIYVSSHTYGNITLTASTNIASQYNSFSYLIYNIMDSPTNYYNGGSNNSCMSLDSSASTYFFTSTASNYFTDYTKTPYNGDSVTSPAVYRTTGGGGSGTTYYFNTTISGGSSAGEWVQITNTYLYNMTSLTLTQRSGSTSRFPYAIDILGGNSALSSTSTPDWVLIGSYTNTAFSATTFSPNLSSNTGYYYNYRIVVKSISYYGASNAFQGTMALGEMTFSGTQFTT
jgi:hypothetical protein